MPTLHVYVPTGTADAQERYEEVMSHLETAFAGILRGPIGNHGDAVEVSPTLEERFYWLHNRCAEGTIADFTYNEK